MYLGGADYVFTGGRPKQRTQGGGGGREGAFVGEFKRMWLTAKQILIAPKGGNSKAKMAKKMAKNGQKVGIFKAKMANNDQKWAFTGLNWQNKKWLFSRQTW